MDVEKSTSYEIIFELMKNSQLTEKPTSEFVQQILEEYIKYVDELTKDLLFCNSSNNNFIKYIIPSNSEIHIFYLYALIRDIFNISGGWQNLALTDLVNPTPKRNTIILNLIGTLMKQYFVDCLNEAHKICDNHFASNEEYEHFCTEMDALNKIEQERILFLAKFEETDSKLLDKKQFLQEKLNKLDENNELNALETEIIHKEELNKHLMEKLRILKDEENDCMEKIVCDEEHDNKIELRKNLLESEKELYNDNSHGKDGLEFKHKQCNDLDQYSMLLTEQENNLPQLEEITQQFIKLNSDNQLQMQQFAEIENATEKLNMKKEELCKNLQFWKAKQINYKKIITENILDFEPKIEIKKNHLHNYQTEKLQMSEKQKKLHNENIKIIRNLIETEKELEEVVQKCYKAILIIIAAQKFCSDKLNMRNTDI